MKDTLQGQIRHLLTVASGALLAGNYDDQNVLQLVGAVVLWLIAAAWSAMSKKVTAK